MYFPPRLIVDDGPFFCFGPAEILAHPPAEFFRRFSRIKSLRRNKHTRQQSNLLLFLQQKKKKTKQKNFFPNFFVVLVCPDGADGFRVEAGGGRRNEPSNTKGEKNQNNKKRRAHQPPKNQENHPSFIMSIEEE